jgi:uncharacterized protein (TIGR03083 family)
MNPELRRETDETFAHTLRLIDAISPEQATLPGACGEWSARDVVAHFTGWHPEARSRLQDLLEGVYERRQYDFDSFNAASVDARRHRSWAEVVAEFKQSHDAFVAFASAREESLWEDKRARGWLIAVTSEHYPEHYEHLERARTLEPYRA